jgi:hypothetical protein
MADRRSGMVQSMGYPHSSSSVVSRAVAAAAANRRQSSMRTGRASKQYSVSAFYSMAAEQDVEVEDDLAQGLFRSISNNPPHTLSILILPIYPLLRCVTNTFSSTTPERLEIQDFHPIKEKFRSRT